MGINSKAKPKSAKKPKRTPSSPPFSWPEPSQADVVTEFGTPTTTSILLSSRDPATISPKHPLGKPVENPVALKLWKKYFDSSAPEFRERCKQEHLEEIEIALELSKWILSEGAKVLKVPFKMRRSMKMDFRDSGQMNDAQVREWMADAETLRRIAEHLKSALTKGDIDLAVNFAIRQERMRRKIQMRLHEANAASGRLHKEISREGRVARTETAKRLAKKVMEDYMQFKKDGKQPPVIVKLLAKKHIRSAGHIRRLLKTKA